MQTPVERIVNVLRGNGRTDAQNAETARRILAALEAEPQEPARQLLLSAA